MSDGKQHPSNSRREAFTGVTAFAAGGCVSRAHSADTMTAAPGSISVARKGKYEMAELKQRSINISTIQSAIRSVDIHNLKKTMVANLNHVVRLIDRAQYVPEE